MTDSLEGNRITKSFEIGFVSVSLYKDLIKSFRKEQTDAVNKLLHLCGFEQDY